MSVPLSGIEYRLLVEHSPVMIWRAGLDAKCDYFNERWLAFTGRPLAKEVGDGWAEGVHPDDLAPCVKTYLDHFHRREAFEMEYRLRRHDGVYRWIFDRGVPFAADDGVFAGFIGSCIDIEERRRAETAREEHNAEQLADARSFEQWMIAIVSHDLRSPLATIDTSARLLATNAGDASMVKNFASRIVRSAERVTHMVSDLLDLSRERHGGGIPLTRAASNLQEIVHQVADELATSSGRRIALVCDEPATGSWDAGRVAQAVSNLLGNAVQHSPAGSIVSAQVQLDAGRALLDVHNEGAIPAGALPTLFEPFGAGATPRARGQGLGLGLFIVRAIARAHGGSIEVDSSPDRGTVFRLALPAR